MIREKSVTTLARLGAVLTLIVMVLGAASTARAQDITVHSDKTIRVNKPPSKKTNQIRLTNYEAYVVTDKEEGWTDRKITGYAPGDLIPFRITVESNGAASGQFQVRFTGDTKKCLAFDNFFIFNAIEYISGTLPTVTLAGNPSTPDFAVPENFGTPRAEWVVTFNISFASAGQARIYHFLQLSDQAGNCTGVPPHSRLHPSDGDVDRAGLQLLWIRLK